MALDSVSQLGQSIGKMSNEQQEIKSAMNPNQANAQTFRVFNDKVYAQQGPLIVLKRDILSSTIWGAFSWNEKPWNGSYSQGFILGNVSAGVLGSSVLGDPGTDQFIALVHNQDGKFYEHFLFDTLIDTTNTTATLNTTDGTVTFSAGDEEVLYSKIVARETDDDTLEVQNVRVSLTGTDVSNAEIFVKTDDNDWQEVVANTKTTLVNKGSKLYYKIDNGRSEADGFPTEFGTWGDIVIGAMTLTDIEIKYEVA